MAHHQNIEMPIFGKAGTTAQSDWTDVETFDVEMLAEYLLDDSYAPMPHIGNDFKVDHIGAGSGFVSPENSEDGGQTPVRERRAASGSNSATQQQPATQAMSAPLASLMAPNMLAPVSSRSMLYAQLAPLAPAPLGMASGGGAMNMFSMPGMGQVAHPGMMFQDQQAIMAAAVSANDAKRRRIDQGISMHQQPQQQMQQQQMQQQQQLMPQALNFTGASLAQGMPMLAVAGMAAFNGLNPAGLLGSGQLAAAAAVQAMQQQKGRGVRKKSQAQIDRRRERNRILARRTRLRKKFFFEALQKEVLDLQKENGVLKELVKENLPEEHSKPVLDECDAMEKMPPSVLEAINETAADIDSKDFNLVRSIQNSQHCFVISDPSLQDNPIVFASDDFCKLTGYKREEILGRNCRFLQGAETSKEKVKMVRSAVEQGEDVSVTFVNYKADGTPFWNKLFIASLRDAQSNIVNFIGVSVKVAGPLPDDSEYGKRIAGDDEFNKDDDDLDDDDDDDDEDS